MKEYIDMKNNRHEVVQTVLPCLEDKEEREREIVEALYRIFCNH